MLKIKFAAIICVLAFVGVVLNNSQKFSSKAENDPILQQISGYKNWTRVGKEPVEIALNQSSAFG